MSLAEYSANLEQQTLVIKVAGEIDRSNCDRFSAWLLDLGHRARRRHIVLELSKLTYVDSAGLRALLGVRQLVAERPVLLRDPQPNVQRRIADIAVPGLFETERSTTGADS